MRNIKKTIFILLAVLILLVFFNYFGVLTPIKNLFQRTFSLIGTNLYRNSISLPSSTLSKEEINNLEKENKKLLVDQAKFILLSKENDALRKEINFIKRHQKSDYILSNLIGRSTDGIFNFFILDKGSADGLLVDLPVINQGILLGKIKQVDKYIAKVLPILSNYSQVTGIILSKDYPQRTIEKSLGLVKGEYNLAMKMELPKTETEIEPGDLVVTSGIEDLIPRGLLIGRVTQIKSVPSSFFQEVIIQPMESLDNLTLITVVK